jgi:hypothetical protein
MLLKAELVLNLLLDLRNGGRCRRLCWGESTSLEASDGLRFIARSIGLVDSSLNQPHFDGACGLLRLNAHRSPSFSELLFIVCFGSIDEPPEERCRSERFRRCRVTQRPLVGAHDMLWLALFIGASAAVGGYASYQRNAAPQLEHRPGVPMELVQLCRDAVVTPAQAHASEAGAELVRVDATSAGPIQSMRNLKIAPVEVGIVYNRQGLREVRQGVVQCRLDRRGRAVIADLAGATR